MPKTRKRPAVAAQGAMGRPKVATKATAKKPNAANETAKKPNAANRAAPKNVVPKKVPKDSLSDSKSDLAAALAWIEKSADPKVRESMKRYAIPAENAVGIPVGTLKAYAKKVGRSHELAEALWKSGGYEARMLATFVGDPARCTPEQMDRWRKDFDSWAICDTACFALFDRSPHAFSKVRAWSKLKDEWGKRAAFALLASLSVHDKKAPDSLFEEGLTLVEAAASDERNFVKKAVNWALRSVGKRNAKLHSRAMALSERLSTSSNSAERWIGKDAVRDLVKAGERMKAKNK
jgi:3-methyladenine DNA glycosylase AlkD